MKLAITGANGFVAQNLAIHAAERGHSVEGITRKTSETDFERILGEADFIFHLAAANRPKTEEGFDADNRDLTEKAIAAVEKSGRSIPIAYTSSIQAELDNPYGRSKKAAEDALFAFHERTGNPVHIGRLPNIFGKWARPNYNSVIATFCHNIARGKPVEVHDPDAEVRMVYVDDVCHRLLALLDGEDSGFFETEPEYSATVGELKTKIEALAAARHELRTEPVGKGLDRALHATFLAALPEDEFAYEIPAHTDPRGSFSEVLKTHDSGQFSFFTAHPGVTRGGHYHHSKTEKFLVVKGRALFKFRHIVTDETHQLETSDEKPVVVETIPGWSHDITNVGEEEMIVMLWANEVFDREKPDTVQSPV